MQSNLQALPDTGAPDPKKSKPKDINPELEDTDVVNGQSQSQVTNDSEMPEPEPDDPSVSEEDRDEKINNLRDALNSDAMPLPDDERDDEIVN